MKNLFLFLAFVSFSCIGATLSAVGKATVAYTGTNVDTSTWATVHAGLTQSAQSMEIFDNSGQVLVIGFGAAASEVQQFYIMPGGNGRFPVYIPKNTRVAVKAISAAPANGTKLYVNFYP